MSGVMPMPRPTRSKTGTSFSLVVVALIASSLPSVGGEGIAEPILPYETKYYSQTLDHLDDSSSSSRHPRWSHRYLINDDYFGRPTSPSGDSSQLSLFFMPSTTTTALRRRSSEGGGGLGLPLDLSPAAAHSCPGPILLYTGNEGPITAFWNGNGFMHYLAQKWGGLLLFPEQRYYGESMPSREMKYLSTEQVLLDCVEIVRHIKDLYGLIGGRDCPVVTFGGSYGGTLSTFLRASHPDVVIGALASSAPVGYYDREGWEEHGVTEYTWADIAADAYRSKYVHPQCMNAIRTATDVIDAATPEEVARAFRLCEGDKLKPRQSSLFSYALEGLPQQNYPYKIGNMPAWPVAVVCTILVSALLTGDGSDASGARSASSSGLMLEAAANVTFMAMGYIPSSSSSSSPSSPPNDDCFHIPEEGPGNVPGDGPGTGSWGYQSCTETLHQFSSRGFASGDDSEDKSGLREYKFSMSEAIRICEDTWRGTPEAIPNSTTLTDKFGGYRLGDGLTNITNIIWSVGLLDPWTGGCFRGRDWKAPGGKMEREQMGIHFFEMARGAHHLDLRGWHPKDPKEVRDVRRKEEEVIRGWIDEWVRSRRTEKMMPVAGSRQSIN